MTTNGGPEAATLRRQIADLQRQLMRSERLALLGTLAAGIAHELNNPIGFVRNNALMLQEYLDALLPILRQALNSAREPDAPPALVRQVAESARGEDLEQLLADIGPLLQDTVEGADRVAGIVTGLRRFTRPETRDGTALDLNRCLEDTLKVAWNELKYKAEVTLDLGELPPLQGHAGELGQVILNLLINAAQALPEFGTIHVYTRPEGSGAMLGVRDNGVGIAAADLPRIFEPFFTTKPAGSGTGLGLAISHDIVTAHGGRIEVSSQPGSGTELRVWLPAVSTQEPPP
jgi:two-component system NtrC family sensor kinase